MAPPADFSLSGRPGTSTVWGVSLDFNQRVDTSGSLCTSGHDVYGYFKASWAHWEEERQGLCYVVTGKKSYPEEYPSVHTYIRSTWMKLIRSHACLTPAHPGAQPRVSPVEPRQANQPLKAQSLLVLSIERKGRFGQSRIESWQWRSHCAAGGGGASRGDNKKRSLMQPRLCSLEYLNTWAWA